MDFVARFLGRTLAYTYEVVEHELGRQLVMRTTDGSFPMEMAMRRETAKDLARLKALLEGRS